MMGFWRIGGLLCLVACSHAPAAAPPFGQSGGIAHYTVTIFDNFGGARVRACVEGGNIRALVPARRLVGPSILLLPASDATVGELESDWVAIHELSHLWMPRLYPGDRWLSEGIATYLQEVLRARCGLQSRTKAWTRIKEGFDRGRRSGTGRGVSAESSR
jgi:hypothetical protein